MPTTGLKDLVRNPLGIVALFISLIYGIASLLLGVTAQALLPDERSPLIAFVTLFPLVVLGVFYLLVTRHHGKLYAPGDFKNDDSFLRTLSAEEVEQRRQTEINEVLRPEPVESTPTKSPTAETGVSSGSGEVVRARTTDSGANLPSTSQLFEEVRKVEVSAIARLERELDQSATRNIEISKAGVSFDAFISGGAKPTFVEVKFLARPLLQLSVLERVLYSALLADRALHGNFRLIVVAVYAFPKSELPRIERLWRQKIEKCPAEVELRFIARDELDA